MNKIKTIKNLVFTFITAWILTPVITANAFAGGQINNWRFFEISLSDSIGYAMKASLGIAIFTYIELFYIIPFLLIIGYFLHRKYIIPLFGGLYAILFILANIIGEFSIREFAVLYFLALIGIILTFFSSTLFNRIRKKKQNFSKKEYLPLGIILVFTLLLLLIPIELQEIFN